MQQFRSSCFIAVATAAILALFAAPSSATQIPVRVLPVPEGTSVSLAFDANASGEVVGAMMGVDGVHAVLWKDGALTILDSPDDGVLDDSVYLIATAVNARGQAIGYTYDTGQGFVWTPKKDNDTTGTMADIGVPPGSDVSCLPVDINDSGQVIAVSYVSEGDYHGFLWETTGKTVLTWTETDSTTDPPTSTEYPIDASYGAINNAGQIVGRVHKVDSTCPAVLWEDGNVTELTPGKNVFGTYINSSGTVAGDQEAPGGNPWLYTSEGGLRWIDLLGAFSGLETTTIRVAGLNDLGQVLITAEDSTGAYRCFLWKEDGTANGAFLALPVSGGMPSFQTAKPVCLNNQGQVAGAVGIDSGVSGFYWDPATPNTVQTLGLLPGGSGAMVLALSDAPLIAGFCDQDKSIAVATTWDPTAPPNHSPVLTVPEHVTVALGFPVTFTATATDPDPNETLTFIMSGAPQDATFDPVTGVFSWFPGSTGTYYCEVTVLDSGGAYDTKTVTVTVAAPVISPQPTDLGVIGDATDSEAIAVNASGQIVGNLWSGLGNDIHTFLWLPEAIGQPGDANYKPAGMNVIDLPDGYPKSEVADINSHGEVVGLVRNEMGGDLRAFLWLPQDAYGLTAGTHLLEGLEGDGTRYAVDINDAGQIVVGSWASAFDLRGYVWQNGEVTALTRNGDTDPTYVFPGYSRKSLNEAGQVAGGYGDVNGVQHAVLWQNGVATDAADPASLSRVAALNGKGEVVGDLDNESDVFLYLPEAAYGLTAGSHALRADLRYSGSGIKHHAFDINANGRIVGSTSDRCLWAWENGAFRDLAPMTESVDELSINATGAAAGFAHDFQYHGYFYSDTAGFLKLLGLGSGSNKAHAINDANLVVGSSVASDGHTHACVWNCATPNRPPILSVPAFVVGTVGNELAFIAAATDADRDPLTFTLLDAPSGATMTSAGYFAWTPGATGIFSATVQVADSSGAVDTETVQLSVWPAGSRYAPTDLGVLDGFTNSGAIDINAAGQVVGDCFNEAYDPMYSDWVPTNMRAFVWQNGVMTELPLLDNYTHSRAYAINALGQIAGECDTTGLYDGQPQACLWEYDADNSVWTVRGLGFLPGHNVSTVDWQIRKPINDLGQVICLSYNQDPGGFITDVRGFLWQNSGDNQVTPLEDASVTPAVPIFPIALNNLGQIIGSATYGDPEMNVPEAVVWASTGVTRLTPDHIAEPNATNNHGQIVGNYEEGIPMVWLPEAIGQPGDSFYWPTGLSLFPEMYGRTFEAINDAGQVLIHDEHWEGDERLNDLSIAPLVANSIGLGTIKGFSIDRMAMNASGQVVGIGDKSLFDPATGDYLGSMLCGFYGSPRTGTEWDRLLLLGGLGGPRTGALSINAGGTIAGYSAVPGDEAIHACVWTAPQPTPQPPSLFVPSQVNAVVGSPVTFTATATDPDADILSFSLQAGAPSGAAIDPTTGVFTWTPDAGSAVSVVVQVSDGTFTTSRTVQITVYPARTPLPVSLGVLPGFQHSWAVGINASGIVTGDCYNTEVPSEGEDKHTTERAFVWQNGVMTALPLLEGYTYSHANAINAQGKIVGRCSKAMGMISEPQACLWEYIDGAWHVTGMGVLAGRDPAHNASEALLINDAGLITGESWVELGEAKESFFWQDNAMHAFSDLPTNPLTGVPYQTIMVRAMNESGLIVGNASDAFWTVGPGVVWNANTHQTVKSFEYSDLGAINTAGQVAGRYVPVDEYGNSLWENQRVFVWDRATDQQADLGNPCSGDPSVVIPDAFPIAISDSGSILLFGYVWYDTNGDGTPDGDAKLRSWLYSDYWYMDLYYVVDGTTNWAALSPTGKVAGNTDTPRAFHWNVGDYAMWLPGLGGDQQYVRALNINDQVAGAATLDTGQKRAVVWNVPETPAPPTLYVPARTYGEVNTVITFTATATDRNKSDTLTFSLTEAPDGATIDPATGVFTWTSAVEGAFYATVQVTDGIYTDSGKVRIDVYPAGLTLPASLGVLPGFDHSLATAINASGVVVGDCFNGSRSMPEQRWEWTYTDRRAFVWQDGQMTELPRLDTYPYSHAEAINASGQIVGYCCTSLGYTQYSKACLWQYDTGNAAWTVTPLEWLAGEDPAHNASAALAIDAAGLVVGLSWTEDAYNSQCVIWRDGQVDIITNLPEGYPYFIVMGLGANGTVIGYTGSQPWTSDGPAVAWDANTPHTLVELPNAYLGAVNASGQVAGTIVPRDADGVELLNQEYVFLWTPGNDTPENLGVPQPTVVPDGLTYLYTSVYVYGLSDTGDILLGGQIGFGSAESGNNSVYTIYPTWVYSNGAYTQIAGSLTDQVSSCAMGPAGDVAGWYTNHVAGSNYPFYDAFFWDNTGPARVLPGLGGDDTRAAALNDLKQVAGSSMTGDGKMRAVIWTVAPASFALNGVPESVIIDEMAPYSFTATATHPNPSAVLTYSLTDAPEGAAINPSSGGFTWTPSEAQGPGTSTFTVTVTDNATPQQSVSKTVNITVNEVNQAPDLQPVPDQEIGEGTTLGLSLSATDGDLPIQALTYSLTSSPDGATLDPATGAFAWTPTEAQGPGDYSVTAAVSDGTDSASVIFAVHVNEVNQAPDLQPVPDQAIDEGTTLGLTLSATDDDLPTQALTYSLAGGPAGMTVTPEGQLTWTPTEAQGPGNYADIAVQVSDGIATTTVTFTVHVNEVNQAPSLANPGAQTLDEQTPLSLNLDATDNDRPAQTLTFSLTSKPAGMTIDAGSGAITWTPTDAQGPGDYNVTAAVSDGTDSASETFTVHVNEVNLPPSLTVPATLSGTVGTAVTFKATATDPDPHPTVLTFSLGSDAPSTATINATTGDFTWTPAAAGTVSFHVVVTDSGGLTDSHLVTVSVADKPSSALTVAVTGITRAGKSGLTTVKVTVTNPGSATANNTVLTSATLAGYATTTPMPLSIGTIKPRATKNVSLQFKGVPAGSATLNIALTCSLGPTNFSKLVTVP